VNRKVLDFSIHVVRSLETQNLIFLVGIFNTSTKNYKPNFCIKSSIFCVPIDELHDTQIGFKLSNLISPPLNSEII